MISFIEMAALITSSSWPGKTTIFQSFMNASYMLIPSSSVCANSKKYACVFCVVNFSVLVWTMGDRIQIILCQAFPTSRQY